jgi:hypothetical protein
MKPVAVLVVIFTLLVPTAARPATEASLGGFIKLLSFWDSTQTANHMNTPIQRNNNPNFHHGQMNFTAQETRFNFYIKGPKVWGANLTGFIEMDFDNPVQPQQTAASGYTPMMRHAMFRLNWPETELLLGQTWSMLSEWFPEVGENGPFQGTGTFIGRPAQVRLTQKFLKDWTAAALICAASGASLPTLATFPYGGSNSGSAAESPQVQAKIAYQHDWWGKAAFFGKPLPLTVQVTAGWQRNVMRRQNLALMTFGQNAFVNFNGSVRNQYFNPWVVLVNLFVPVIPTRTFNMAGTASILTQWWICQGPEAFGAAGIVSSIYRFNNNLAGNNYDVELQKRWGGYVQAQYYFTNQWYLTAVYGLSKAFGVSQDQNPFAPGNRVNAFSADQQKSWQEVDVVLWYRPVLALKFGLQYTFSRTDWFQKLTTPVGGPNASDYGTQHRVQFIGFFFF